MTLDTLLTNNSIFFRHDATSLHLGPQPLILPRDVSNGWPQLIFIQSLVLVSFFFKNIIKSENRAVVRSRPNASQNLQLKVKCRHKKIKSSRFAIIKAISALQTNTPHHYTQILMFQVSIFYLFTVFSTFNFRQLICGSC